MRDLDLVDAVIKLHDVARLIEEAIGHGQLSDDVRKCADRLHDLSLIDNKISPITNKIINKAKNDF
jgi:hypothetical protein